MTRTRSLIALAIVVVAVALAAVVGLVNGSEDPASSARSAPLALPDRVNAPGPWSDDELSDEPLAAVGLARRMTPVGLSGSRTRIEPYGVSALDGRSGWLDLPGLDSRSALALSPDGRRLGWSLTTTEGRGPSRLLGWSVADLSTGSVVELEGLPVRSLRNLYQDPTFSGNSTYLLTSYALRGRERPTHQFVAWDVETGEGTGLGEQGDTTSPQPASAPSDVAWARGRTVYRADPAAATGEESRSSVDLPHRVVTASWAPDDRAFAYIGAPQGFSGRYELYAGPTLDRARSRPFDLPRGFEPSEILGWVDAQQVVVGDYSERMHVVDLVTGDVVEQTILAASSAYGPPILAADLWQQPRIDAPEPTGTSDPRRPWQWVAGVLAVLVVLVGAVVAGRRYSPGPGAVAAADAGTSYAPRPPPDLGPLRRVATGLVLVLVDFRINGFDLVPDPIGWAIVATALTYLTALHGGFRVAVLVAWVAVVPSILTWGGAQNGWLSTVDALLFLTVIVALCTALVALSPTRAAAAVRIRALTIMLSTLLLLGLLAVRGDPTLGALVLLLGVVDLLVVLWFVVTLYGAARDSATGPRQPVVADLS